MAMNIKDLDPSEYEVIDTISTRKAKSKAPQNIKDLDPSEYEVISVSESEILPPLGERAAQYAGELAVDIPVGLYQGLTESLGGELYGLAAGMVGDKKSEEYEAQAEEIINRARSRSPIATGLSEITGSTITGGPLKKAISKVPIAKLAPNMVTALTEGALQGAGEAGPGESVGTSAAVGAALSGAGQSALGIGRSLVESPDIRRAKVVLGSAENMSPARVGKIKIGSIEDPKALAQELKKTGFFIPTKNVEFDYGSMKFKPSKGKLDLVKELKNPTPDDLMERAEKTVSFLNDKNKTIVENSRKAFLSEGEFFDVLGKLSKEFSDPVFDQTTVRNAFEKVYKEAQENFDYLASKSEANRTSAYDILSPAKEKFITAKDVETLKNKLWADVKKIIGVELGDDLSQTNKQMKLSLAAKMADKLSEKLGVAGEQYRMNNRLQSRLLTASDDIFNKSYADEWNQVRSTVKEGPLDYLWNKAIQKTQPALMYGGDISEKTPEYIDTFLRQIPGQVIQGREPQSIPQVQPDPINKLLYQESMIRTPLPRSTDEILQKKDFVLEKIRLQAPNLYPHAAEIIKNQPEMLDEFLAGAIVKFPFIFEKDKYNRVNGKIIDPMLQEKARKDITRKQGISNTEKVAMYHRLNITNGEYDG